MSSEVLSLILRARDEMSGEIAKAHREVRNLSGGVGALRAVLQGIGMGVGFGIFGALKTGVQDLANAIPGMISRGLEFTNLVDELGDATGAAAEDTSRLIGTYQLLGIGTENLGTRMGQLSKVIVNNEQTVNAYGIATRDASGHLLNQVQIVENARHQLARYADGTTKAAVMTRLFGRAGLDMADYLSLSDGQVRLISGDLKQMGVILSSETAKKAEAAKIELRRFDLVMQGLANQLVANVLPAIISAANGLANWVRDNGRQIAQFAAQVVNFVLGMVSALTGATFTTATFTDKLGEVSAAGNEAGNSLDGMGEKAARGGARSTAAIDRQIVAIDRLIATVERQDKAQQVLFDRERARQLAAQDARLAALDAEEKALAIAARRADLQDAIARAAAGDDPARLAEAQQAAADYEAQLVRDTKRDQIETTRDQVDAVFDLYQNTENKKAVLATLTRLLANREADLARARAAGDMAEVERLTAVAEAMKTTIARTQQDLRNADRVAELEKQKAHFEAIKAAASRAGAAVGTAISAGAAIAGGAISTLSTDADRDIGLIARRLGEGKKPDTLVGAMEVARQAGMAFGRDLHDAMVGADGNGGALRAIKDVAKSLGDILQALRDIMNLPGSVWANLENFATGSSNIGGPGWDWQKGIFEQNVFHPPPGIEGKAGGGWVGLRGPEIVRVGERGPEYITPNAALGGGTLTVNVTVQGTALFDPYGQAAQQIAAALLPGLQREVARQGTSL